MARFSVRKKQVIAALAFLGPPAVLLLFLSTKGEAPDPDSSLSYESEQTDSNRLPGEQRPLAGRYIDVPDFLEKLAEAPARGSWNCRVEDLPQFSVFTDDEHSARLSDFASSLAASRNAEHLLAAAMLSEVYGKGAADVLLESALDLDPTNTMVLWWAADLCARQHSPDACKDPTIRKRIRAANRDNGAYWATLANQQLRNGDKPRAIESLRRASTAASLDYKLAQQVLLLERGLSAVSDLSYEQRFTMALAAAPLLGVHREVYAACRELIKDDLEWAQACLEFGRRLADDSTTVIFKMIGYGIQRNVLGETGDANQLRVVNEARESLRRGVRDYAYDWNLLMLADPRFVAQYVDQFAVHGEVAAMHFVRKEIARLKALPDYDPCSLAEVGDRSAVSQ